jgi:hypothetical protein
MIRVYKKNLFWNILLLTVLISCSSSRRHQEQSEEKARKQVVLRFNQVWVWRYQQSGPSGNSQGEMAVYYNDTNKTWLFNKESYNNADMVDWVLARPDGRFIIAWTDEHSDRTYTTQQVQVNTANETPAYYQPGAGEKAFGDPALGFDPIAGREYKVSYEKTTEQVMAWIGHTAAPMSALYHFNPLDLEAKLPIWFDGKMPADRIILAENYRHGNERRSFEFRFVSPTEYEVYLPAALQ